MSTMSPVSCSMQDRSDSLLLCLCHQGCQASRMLRSSGHAHLSKDYLAGSDAVHVVVSRCHCISAAASYICHPCPQLCMLLYQDATAPAKHYELTHELSSCTHLPVQHLSCCIIHLPSLSTAVHVVVSRCHCISDAAPYIHHPCPQRHYWFGLTIKFCPAKSLLHWTVKHLRS